MFVLYSMVLMVVSAFVFYPVMLSSSPCPCRESKMSRIRRQLYNFNTHSRRDVNQQQAMHPDAEVILKEFYNHMISNHWNNENMTSDSFQRKPSNLEEQILENAYNGTNVQGNLSYLCSFLPPTTTKPFDVNQDYDKLSSVQVYGYGTLAVLIISFCSLAGILCLPMIQWSTYRHLITGFIAFGLGVMMGDAVLHLIPEALLISETVKGDRLTLWRSLFIMITIYALFTFESLMELVHHEDESSHRCPRRHSHSHIPFPEDFQKTGSLTKQKSAPLQPSPSELSAIFFESALSDSETYDQEKIRKHKVEFHQSEPVLQQSRNPCQVTRHGWKTLALVIILGDTIHNFGDGLAVGAAFTSGVKSGISTSLAIFCHELPHEFGDFVILMTSGLTFRKALLVNLCSAITAFLGLYVGIILGDNSSARRWIFAFTAGTFIYIAIGDMLPELRNHNKNVGVFIVQNISMVMGMALMMTVAVYEHGMFNFI